MQSMYYIGLDVHKKKISYCVKDGSGIVHAEGAIPATRWDLDRWMKMLPRPRRKTIASMPTRLPTAYAVIFYRNAIWLRPRFANGGARYGIEICWSTRSCS